MRTIDKLKIDIGETSSLDLGVLIHPVIPEIIILPTPRTVIEPPTTEAARALLGW